MSDHPQTRILARISNTIYPFIYTAALIILSGSWLTACRNQVETAISIATPQSTLTSLIWLTEELGFFEEQAINLELHAYPSGKRALAAMMRGDHALAATAETPFVIASFTHDDLRLFATMGQSDNEIRVLARRDHHINEPADLLGKTIATQEGSAVHFFLTSFLLYHQLDSSLIDTRFMKAEALPEALAKGDIDAFSMRDPFISQSKKLIGTDKLVEFSVPGLYTKTYNIVGSKGFVNKHPGVMQKILFALNQGADYADRNPQKAIEIISKRLQLPYEHVAKLWPDMRLAITLNQGLLTTLQEEAEWAIATGRVKESELTIGHIPDMLSRLDPAPLTRALPYAVGLIGIEPQ